jgi:hypothetical protein
MNSKAEKIAAIAVYNAQQTATGARQQTFNYLSQTVASGKGFAVGAA